MNSVTGRPKPSGKVQTQVIELDVRDTESGRSTGEGPATQTLLHFQPGATSEQFKVHAPDAPPSSHTSDSSRILLPHTLQTLFEDDRDVSAVQTAPFSTTHKDEHPSPETKFPSSHCSLKIATTPSPQLVLHMLRSVCDFVVQAQPISVLHAELHPSQLFKFPSSHSSPPCRIPFPQPEVQTDLLFVSLHDQPCVTVQFWSQPSPSTVLPSSHASDWLHS